MKRIVIFRRRCQEKSRTNQTARCITTRSVCFRRSGVGLDGLGVCVGSLSFFETARGLGARMLMKRKEDSLKRPHAFGNDASDLVSPSCEMRGK